MPRWLMFRFDSTECAIDLFSTVLMAWRVEGCGREVRNSRRVTRSLLYSRMGATEIMEYVVESMSILMEGGYFADPNDEYSSTSAIVLPGSVARFTYPWIAAPIDPILPGVGEYSVRYRHPTDPLDFRTNHKFIIGWQAPPGGPHSVRWLTEGRMTHERVLDDD